MELFQITILTFLFTLLAIVVVSGIAQLVPVFIELFTCTSKEARLTQIAFVLIACTTIGVPVAHKLGYINATCYLPVNK